MKNNKEKNNLLQKNVPDKIKYIRQKILLDRLMSGEDIDEATEELMKSMSDLEIYGIIREESVEIIISSYAPFITNFNNFMKLLDNSPEYISKYVTFWKSPTNSIIGSLVRKRYLLPSDALALNGNILYANASVSIFTISNSQ